MHSNDSSLLMNLCASTHTSIIILFASIKIRQGAQQLYHTHNINVFYSNVYELFLYFNADVFRPTSMPTEAGHIFKSKTNGVTVRLHFHRMQNPTTSDWRNLSVSWSVERVVCSRIVNSGAAERNFPGAKPLRLLLHHFAITSLLLAQFCLFQGGKWPDAYDRGRPRMGYSTLQPIRGLRERR